MTDKFAEVMLSNLDSRQCELHTTAAQSKQSQMDRYVLTLDRLSIADQSMSPQLFK